MVVDAETDQRHQAKVVLSAEYDFREQPKVVLGANLTRIVRISPEVDQEFPFHQTPTAHLNAELEEYMKGFHPFTVEVIKAQLPEKWKWPKVDSYDGTSDSDAQVKAYMTQANLFSRDLRVHWRLIPTILKGTTLKWYYSLPRNSVNLFRTLSSNFIARFIDNKPITTSSASLHHVTEGKNESLRQYMARFAKACLNIPNLHPDVATRALTVGLKPDLFLNTLFAELPSNMDELRPRATNITIEENTEAVRRTETPMITTALKRKRIGRFDSYTPLNASRDVVIQEAYNLELVRLLQPMESPPSIDPTKRCWNHQNYDRTTEECIKVCNVIEELDQDLLIASFNKAKAAEVTRDEETTEEAEDEDKANHQEVDKVATEEK